MRIQLRLAKLLEVEPYGNRAVSELAREMNIGRHQLMHMLDENSKQINRRVLEAVCNYLIDKKHVARADLPQILFALEPHQFWSMLKSCETVLLTMGERWDQHWRDDVVVAADSALHSVLLRGLTVADTGTDGGRDDWSQSRSAGHSAQHAPHIESRLVTSWVNRTKEEEPVQRAALKVMTQHLEAKAESALICIGSIKSNPVTEHVLARIFAKAKPFKSEDDVADPHDRSCPFAFIYRKKDVHCESCWAGSRLHRFDASGVPGIYYETANGTWASVLWNVIEHDGAILVYQYHRVDRKLEMVIGGFTGRATRCMAEVLRENAADFWPPSVQTRTCDIGVFVIPCFAPATDQTEKPFHDRLQYRKPIRVCSNAITSRLSAADHT